MDQPGLAHHVAFHVHEDDHDRLHLKPPSVVLRSLSKSDPHLSIPHLLLSQDEDHPSLNRIVSGLFHVDSALRTPHASCGNLELIFHVLHQNAGSDSSGRNDVIPFQSPRSAIPQSTPLRKSSSATDWSAAMAEVSRKNSKLGLHGTLPKAAADSDPSQSDRHFSLQASEHQNEGCIAMKNPINNKNSSLVAARNPNDGKLSQGVVASAGSLPQPPSTGSTEDQESGRQKSHGLFGGIFQRGFFSKPVMCNEEESYRYLMALDR